MTNRGDWGFCECYRFALLTKGIGRWREERYSGLINLGPSLAMGIGDAVDRE